MVRTLRRLAVFCGSSSGTRPEYVESARRAGQVLAQRGIGLVYGGGAVGLMGAVADGALSVGGEVIGVIPHGLAPKEVAHQGLTDLRIVDTMHERKAMMADLVDGFITLPGGIGTLEELAEVLTWAYLGIHAKPCGVLNQAGYYDPLLSFLDHAVAEGFFKAKYRALLLVDNQIEPLLDKFASYDPSGVRKWLGKSET